MTKRFLSEVGFTNQFRRSSSHSQFAVEPTTTENASGSDPVSPVPELHPPTTMMPLPPMDPVDQEIDLLRRRIEQESDSPQEAETEER